MPPARAPSCLAVTGENHLEEEGDRGASTAEVCVEILGEALIVLVAVAVELGAAKCGASKGFFRQHLLEVVQMQRVLAQLDDQVASGFGRRLAIRISEGPADELVGR